MAKLRDGVEFGLGMPVVFESGRELETNDQEYEVVPLEYQGRTWMTLRRKQGFTSIALDLLYSSQEARIRGQVARLETQKRDIDAEIENLKQGRLPCGSLCSLQGGSYASGGHGHSQPGGGG